MKKLCLIACVAFATFAATPAKADVIVIRWKSGSCEVWDISQSGQPGRPGDSSHASQPSHTSAAGADA